MNLRWTPTKAHWVARGMSGGEWLPKTIDEERRRSGASMRRCAVEVPFTELTGLRVVREGTRGSWYR